nr:hypothetical protein [Tanacetum cinerariifolium]
SWTSLPEFVDDTVTDYHRPTPSIDASKCNKSELQSSNFSVFEHEESTGSIMSKPMIKFVKEADCPRVIKINNTKNTRKSTVKYVEMNVRNKMHKAFPLLVRKFPLPEGTSYCLKMNTTVRRIEMPLPEVCTASEEKKKKLPVKGRW